MSGNPLQRASKRPWSLARAGLAVGLALVTAPSSVYARCRVALGPEGESSAWLAAGPFATPQTRPPRAVEMQLAQPVRGVDMASLQPSAGAAAGALRWSLRVAADARVALAQGTGARTALAAVELHADARTRGFLALGSDDGLAVYLDGRELYHRGAVRDARDDDDLVPFDLAPGAHRLVVRVTVNGGALRLAARVLDERFAPHPSVRVLLPGVDDAACLAAASNAARLALVRRLPATGLELHASVRFPGGAPVPDTLRALPFELRAGARVLRLDASISSVISQVESTLSLADTDTAVATLGLAGAAAGTNVARVSTALPSVVRRALHDAHALDALDEANPPAFLPRESLTSVRYVAERLATLVAEADRDTAHLVAEATTLASLLDDVAHARDPYAARTGPLRRAYRSDVDGTLQGYSIYVPPSYRASSGAFPLVVALHGLRGSAHRMLPVLFGLYDEHEDRTHAERHLPALPDVHALLVAPTGRGDAGYRSLGEVDVLRVVDEVRRAYRTDTARTYMTGLSMGGIGAASIPLHNPGLFAASAPLCGYHSYFVRNDTRGPRRPWELALMESRSNASWAENGEHLPLYVVHGTRDQPTANSRVLVERYEALHYPIESEWPPLGHNVWSTTYAGGRIVSYFSRFRLDPAPRSLLFRTSDLRFARDLWLSVDALEEPGARFGQVRAVAQGRRVDLTLDRITALTVAPPASLFERGLARYELFINGSRVDEAPVGTPAHLSRVDGGDWSLVRDAVVQPLRGSIRDVFDRPVVVVYGTRDETQTAMNRRVASAWARLKPGVRGRIAVVADHELTEAMLRERSLVLVGTSRSNSVLAALESRLPLRADGDALVLAGTTRRFRGAGVGATFTAVHPHRADRMIVVVTGTDARGVHRSRFLPELVPDFVVYDDAVAPARGRILLGRYARVLAAGFWRADGSAPPVIDDPQPRETAADDDERAADED